jgi:hypothetical protein
VSADVSVCGRVVLSLIGNIVSILWVGQRAERCWGQLKCCSSALSCAAIDRVCSCAHGSDKLWDRTLSENTQSCAPHLWLLTALTASPSIHWRCCRLVRAMSVSGAAPPPPPPPEVDEFKDGTIPPPPDVPRGLNLAVVDALKDDILNDASALSNVTRLLPAPARPKWTRE